MPTSSDGKTRLLSEQQPAAADAGAGAAGGGGAAAGGAAATSSSSSSSAAAAAPANDQQVAIYDPEEALRLAEAFERDQAEIAMMQAVLGTVFSVRKPRDAIAGTSSGLKTMAKGIGLGLAALVAQPYVGAKTNGAKGFVKGVGAGLLACSASTVTGTVVGTGQIVRGVMNTPRAIVQKSRGQVWNSETRKWEVDWYSLPEEEAEVFGASAGSGGTEGGDKAGDGGGGGASSSAAGGAKAAPRRPAKRVVDRSLYDLLEVPPEATDAEVRKAFYKKSLALHPDKNPDNPEATQKFQAVSDAYRVLGDEERRRAYDEHGQDSAAAGLPKIEPVVFFAALFGSHHFEPWIGRLRLAQEIDGDLQSLLRDAASSMDEEAPALDMLKVHRAQQQMKKVERERQVRCALNLAKRLDPVVSCSEEARPEALGKWEKEQAAEVAELAKTPCGVELLYIVGWIYANRARQFFAGTVLSRIVAQVEGNLHLANTKASLAGSVGKTCLTVNGVMKQAEKKKLAATSEAEKAAAAAGDSPDDASSKPGGGGSAEAAASGPAEEGAGASPPSGAAGEAAAPDAAKPSKDAKSKKSGACGGKDQGAGASAHDARSGGGGGASAGAGAGGADGGQASASGGGGGSGQGSKKGEADQLPIGTLVILQGLTGAAELNNEVGMVCGFDQEAGRYLVQVMPDVGLKKFRRENLVVLEIPPGFDDGSQGAASSSSAPGGGGGGSADEGQWAQGGEDADMADAFKDCMPLFHDAAWGMTKLDIEFTLDKVVHKILKDMSVSKAVRRQRADALLKLGVLLQAPMLERRKEQKAAKAVEDTSGSAPAAATAVAATPSDERPVSPQSTATSTTTSGKKSILARFKPRAPWRPSAEKKTQKAKAAEEKQKRMEAALAMMAAGASTEDVDEMIAARAAMEAEGGAFPF